MSFNPNFTITNRITEGMTREIHRKLVEVVRGGSAAPREYRRIQNYVVNSGTGLVISQGAWRTGYPPGCSGLKIWFE